MTRRRARVLVVLPVALAASLAAPLAPVTAGEAARVPAALAPVLAGPDGAPTSVVEPVVPSSTERTAAAGASFVVTYSGFTAAAKASFQRAVNAWSQHVVSSVPITINARFEPLGTGVLGSAGPSYLWRDFAGAPRANTLYVDALANKKAGRQLDAAPDIRARFNSGFSNWHFGTAAAPSGTYDFQSVVMHEIGHGLGVLGAGKVANGTGSVRLSGALTAWDVFTENGAGKGLRTYADPSAALATQLQSGNVFFDSTPVRNANGGRPAELYAPARWQQGSSYSHLDEAVFRRGNANSLMTPQIGSGETVRAPGPVGKALLRSIGW